MCELRCEWLVLATYSAQALDGAGELSRRQETAAVPAADADDSDHQSSDEDEEDDVSYLLEGDSQKCIEFKAKIWCC